MTLVEIPLLDEIAVSKWFSTTYNKGQEKEIENLIDNYIWVTVRRQQMLVKEMKTRHINSCIKCWNGEGKTHIPSHYLGGKSKWLRIFETELKNRQ